MSRRSSRRDDQFVRWEDLDLTTLLGEFTDVENGVADYSSDGSDHELPRKQSVKQVVKGTMYRCPEPKCEKVYRSVTGFRGHVANKHKLFDLKAANHIIGMNATSGTCTSASSSSQLSTLEEMKDLICRALGNILTDVENLNPKSKYGQKMIEMAEALKAHVTKLDWLCESFQDAVGGSGISSSADREQLMVKFHDLCNNKRTAFKSFMIETVQVSQPTNCLDMFFRAILEECLDEHLKMKMTLIKRDSSKSNDGSTFSEKDKEVMYYICGYVLNKLTHSKHLTADDRSVLSTFINDENSKNPIKDAEWTTKLNRGGLKLAKIELFNFFMAAERIVRDNVDMCHIGPKSLEKTVLIEKIMEADRVKRAWSLAVPGFCQKMALCEKLVSLYLVVRGFATAKFVKKKVVHNKNLKTKSLRKGLKSPRL